MKMTPFQILPVHRDIAELLARLRVANPVRHDKIAADIARALHEVVNAEEILAIAIAVMFAKLSDPSELPDSPAST